MFDLSPETENNVRNYAAREGVSIDELLARAFPQAHAATELPSDAVERVKNLLTQWNAQHGLPVPPGGAKTLAEMAARWKAEDGSWSDEERAAERAFWEQRERDFDNRPPLAI